MSSTFKAIISRSASLFSTPASSTTSLQLNNSGVATAKDATSLFPTVDPAVYGEDCDRDCASCSIRYPAKFSINEDDELYGHVKGWAVHLMVATGKADWVRDVADEKGSVMEALGKSGIKLKAGRLMVSASNMPPSSEYYIAEEGHKPTTVLVLPSFTLVEHVRPDDVPELMRRFVDIAPTTTTPLWAPPPEHSSQNGDRKDSKSPLSNGHTSIEVQPEQAALTEEPESTLTEEPESTLPEDATTSIPPPENRLTSRPCPHAYLILLCSQKTRDARCGQSAPLLRRELERQLRPLGLYRDLDDERPGGVGIYFISHVGGHKYSANMMIYRKEEGQAIWLARIRPEHIEGVVKHTVLQGKVVHPEKHLRGGFDRKKGLVSW